MIRQIFLTIFISFISFTSLFSQERGKASFYSSKIHGRYMADGSKYHKDSLTCAHRTYPFGTLLKVTNLSNGKNVIVKVCDRGPFRRGRVVDLSYMAAKELGMLSHGVISVEVEPVPENKIPLILDVNCGLKGIKFLKSYQYAIPVIKCPAQFHNKIKLYELPVCVPPRKKHRWYKSFSR